MGAKPARVKRTGTCPGAAGAPPPAARINAHHLQQSHAVRLHAGVVRHPSAATSRGARRQGRQRRQRQTRPGAQPGLQLQRVLQRQRRRGGGSRAAVQSLVLRQEGCRPRGQRLPQPTAAAAAGRRGGGARTTVRQLARGQASGRSGVGEAGAWLTKTTRAACARRGSVCTSRALCTRGDHTRAAAPCACEGVPTLLGAHPFPAEVTTTTKTKTTTTTTTTTETH